MITDRISRRGSHTLFRPRLTFVVAALVVIALGYAYEVREADLASLNLSRQLRGVLLAEIPELNRRDMEFYSYATCYALILDVCAGATFSEQIVKEPEILAKVVDVINRARIKEKVVVDVVRRVPFSRGRPAIVLKITKYK